MYDGNVFIVIKTAVCPLRNESDIIISYCRLYLTTDSFILSASMTWISLDNSVRNVDSVKQLKQNREIWINIDSILFLNIMYTILLS